MSFLMCKLFRVELIRIRILTSKNPDPIIFFFSRYKCRYNWFIRDISRLLQNRVELTQIGIWPSRLSRIQIITSIKLDPKPTKFRLITFFSLDMNKHIIYLFSIYQGLVAEPVEIDPDPDPNLLGKPDPNLEKKPGNLSDHFSFYIKVNIIYYIHILSGSIKTWLRIRIRPGKNRIRIGLNLYLYFFLLI